MNRPNRLPFSSLVALVAALVSQSVHCQNLIPNPNFDFGTKAWQFRLANGEPPTFSIDSTDGSPAAPSVVVTTTLDFGTAADSACVPVNPSLQYDLAVDTKNQPFATNTVQFYSDESCNTFLSSVNSQANTCSAVSNGWQRCSIANITPPATAHSARLTIVFFLNFTTKMDNARFGPTGTVPVELQWFQVD